MYMAIADGKALRSEEHRGWVMGSCLHFDRVNDSAVVAGDHAWLCHCPSNIVWYTTHQGQLMLPF